jgi:non-heme chloroperoxidase
MDKRFGWLGLAFAVLLLTMSLTGAEKPYKDATIQVGDIKIHYIESGTGERNLVFIPDLGMTAEIWREQIPYFVARGFHVVAFDPRSQGLSGKTEGGNNYSQHAADLHAFLQKMKLEHSTFIGWGAGGITVLEYMSSPETLKPDGLVFVGDLPVCPGAKEPPGGLTMQQARDRFLTLQDDRPKAIEAMVRALFKTRQVGPIYKELTDAYLKMPNGAMTSLLFDLATGDRRTILTTLSGPILIVTSKDRQLSGEWLQSKITGAKLQVVPEAGGALFLERPQAFNQALEDFLGK